MSMKIRKSTLINVRNEVEKMLLEGKNRNEISSAFCDFEFLQNKVLNEGWHNEALIPLQCATIANHYLTELNFRKIIKGEK